jgi:competence protein ComEC
VLKNLLHIIMELRSSYRFPFSRYPAVRIALLLAGGVWLHLLLPGSSTLIAGLILFGGILLYLLFHWYTARNVSLSGTSVLTLIYLVIIILAGWFRMATAQRVIPVPAAVLLSAGDDHVQISGHLISVSVNEFETLGGIAFIDSAIIGTSQFAVLSKFRFRLFNADSITASRFIPGTRISGPARPGPFREKRNPHEFDFREWNYRQNIFGELVFDTLNATASEPRGWPAVRNGAYRAVDQIFREENRPLAKAVILGYKGELDTVTRRSFSRAGLSHIMAVSGMHVGFVLMPVWLIFPWLRSSAAGKLAAMLILIAVLVFYAGVTGFTASVMRAGLMAVLLATGTVFCKIRDSLNLVGVAAILLILYDPYFLLDVGFQLSFSAVCIILVSLPVLTRLIPAGIRYTWKGSVITMFGLSVLIQGGLYPVLALYFREFSLIGPFLNIVAVPLAQILFLATFLTLPLVFAAEQIVAYAGIPADLMITALSMIVDLSNESVTGWISVQRPSFLIFCIWISLFGFFTSAFLPVFRWRFAVLLLLSICSHRITILAAEHGKDRMEAVFFDVGQGDSVLIKTPSDRYILYDAGVLSPFSNSGRSVILPYIQEHGIGRLDAVILSHPHADHIGGILTLIEHIEIGVIYQSSIDYHSALFYGYVEAARKKGIPVHDLHQGDAPNLDPRILALVLAPAPGMQSRDPNAHSVVIRIQYGNTVLLLTGDAEEKSELDMYSVFGDLLKSDVLKAGHHGSHTSSHDFFLQRVMPDAVIISCGMRNRYNHPHRTAVERLSATGADLWYTALDGAIVLQSDGITFGRYRWR